MFLIFSSFLLFGLQETTPLKVVANQTTPGPMRLELVEDLRFGPDTGGEHYIWGDHVSKVMVDADDSGNIYVMDPLANRLLKFDSKGEFVTTVAAAGEGPGELGMLLSFRVAADSRSFVFDAGKNQSKLFAFDNNHQYVFTYLPPQEGFVWTYLIFSKDLNSSVALLRKNNFKENNSISRVVFLNDAFEVVHQFSRVETEKETTWTDNKFWEDDYWHRFYERWFRTQMAPRWIAAFLSDGSLIYTDAESYSLDKWSADGKVLQMRITKEHQPIPLSLKDRSPYVDYLWNNVRDGFPEYQRKYITRRVMESGIEAAEVGPYKKTIFGVIPMMDGHFLVVYDASVFADHFKAHIFDGNGVCIGDTQFPGRGVYPWVPRYGFRIMFKKDHVYAVEKNEDDENVVVRYRYRLVER